MKKEIESWDDLNGLFESQDFLLTIDMIPKIILKSPQLTDLARSTKTLAELHFNPGRDPELKKSSAYALLSAYCHIELGRFAPAMGTLDWMKQHRVNAQAIQHLSSLLAKNVSAGTQTKANTIRSAEIERAGPKTPLFSTLTAAEVQEILSNVTSKRLIAGEKLFDAGDDALAFYIVAEGEISLLTPGGETICQEGDFFGEIALLGNRKRTATVKSKTDAVLLEFSKMSLIESFINHPAIEQKVLHFYQWRLFQHLAQQHPLFKDFEKARLDKFYFSHRPIRVKPGDILIQQGAQSSRLCFLLDGHATVSKDGRAIGEILPGEFFGEMGILTESPRSAQIIADSACDYLECPGYSIASVFMQFPELKAWLEKSAQARAPGMIEIRD